MKRVTNQKLCESESGMFRRNKIKRNCSWEGKSKSLPWVLMLLLFVFAFSFSACVPPDSIQSSANSNQLAANSNQSGANNAVTPNIPANAAGSPIQRSGRNFSENPDFDIEGWLAQRVKDKNLHALLIASLEPGRTLAVHNIDKTFNPASVVKLTTTLVALKKMGADHRFKISVLTNGKINDKGTLEGDIYFTGDAPIFDDASAKLIEEELKKRNIKGVSGKIYVSKDFSFNFNDSAERSAGLLADRLSLQPKPPVAVAEKPSGTELFALESYSLREVLRYQNTFSNNFVAQKLGDAVGGVEVINQYLIKELGLPAAEVKLETASGLGENSMTARGVFMVVQELYAELKKQKLKPMDILPVAAEQNSTLGEVLKGAKFAGAVVGKTGTLSAADGGVGMASLAGYIYTKNDGIFIFVFMNQGDEVRKNKDMQNQLLGDVLNKQFELQNLAVDDSRELLPKADLSIKDGSSLPEKQKTKAKTAK